MLWGRMHGTVALLLTLSTSGWLVFSKLLLWFWGSMKAAAINSRDYCTVSWDQCQVRQPICVLGSIMNASPQRRDLLCDWFSLTASHYCKGLSVVCGKPSQLTCSNSAVFSFAELKSFLKHKMFWKTKQYKHNLSLVHPLL